jgi:hypothetical protein
MVKLWRYPFLFSGLLALCLMACGGGGGGTSTPSAPPLADNGGVWVGTWTGTQGSGSGYKGSVVVEMHQDQGALTGYATASDGISTLGRMRNEALIGTVNGAAIQFGVVGQVNYTGTLSGTTAWGSFTDHSSSTTGTWQINRLMEPFTDGVTPAYELPGTWLATPVSTMSPSPAQATIIVDSPILSNTLSGLVNQGSSTYTILTGRISGSTVWYALHPDADTMVVTVGTLSDATHASGSYVQCDVSVSTEPNDRGTWTATKQP